MPNTERGYVYILRDRLNNNEIKVGLSKDPISRIKQLHNTSTALPMYLYYVWEVQDMRYAEKIAHDSLSDHRINNRREFFEILTIPDCISLNISEYERYNYDASCMYLDALINAIEDNFSTMQIAFRQCYELLQD